MGSVLSHLVLPAAVAGTVVALAWPVATGLPTWGALAGGRIGSTLSTSLAAGAVVFTVVQRLTAPAPG